jgi:cell division protein FtsI/penicillin-binding protein 2
LEASLDPYLRGTQGNPGSLLLWDSLLYGTPPPGLDVRLSIDLQLQAQADALLGGFKGAAVLLNAQTGEVLAMASHPGYDPNKLDEVAPLLSQNKDAPLLNRATQGMYPLGTAGAAFSMALRPPEQPSEDDLLALYHRLGFYTTPDMRMTVASATAGSDLQGLRISPLQTAIAASAISHGGLRPAPRIALSVKTPMQGWVTLAPLGEATRALPEAAADAAARQLAVRSGTYWQWTGQAQAEAQTDTWFMAGTLPNWAGPPLALAVLIEGNYPLAAERIGQQIVQSATGR